MSSNLNPVIDNSILTLDKARDALTDILTAIELPENNVKLTEAKTKAGNDMLKMMQFVFPIVMKIQIDVIKNHGFKESREGIVTFSQIIRSLEQQDEEIAKLHSQVQVHFLPSVTICTETSS